MFKGILRKTVSEEKKVGLTWYSVMAEEKKKLIYVNMQRNVMKKLIARHLMMLIAKSIQCIALDFDDA